MKRVALIGYGSIARMVVGELAKEASEIRIEAILVRENRVEAARGELPKSIKVVTAVPELLAMQPDLVVECAGQGAVRDYADAVLSKGFDLMVIATGAFADATLLDQLTERAQRTGARLLLPSGAIAGIDGLTALRVGELDRVRYTSTKPPEAWRGTPAEKNVELATLAKPTVIFDGSPIEAARDYPKNANLAMTVALAGAGVDRTEIQLVADPDVTTNTGRIQAEGRFGRLEVKMEGQPAPDNPRTSAVTALSIIHAIRNLTATVVMG
jgi:aspartate dehydrogenase